MQFAMLLEPISVIDQAVEVLVDRLQKSVARQTLARRVCRKTILPDLVDSLDLAFCLGRVGEDEGDVVELQSLAELRQRSVVVPEEARLVHIDLKRKPISRKSPVKQVQIRCDDLLSVESTADLHPAAVMSISWRIVRNGGRRIIHLTFTHADASGIRDSLNLIRQFLGWVDSIAELLEPDARWTLVLTVAFRKLLRLEPHRGAITTLIPA